jgi:hypothetical protein
MECYDLLRHQFADGSEGHYIEKVLSGNYYSKKEVDAELAAKDQQIRELKDQLNDALSCLRASGNYEAANMIFTKYQEPNHGKS